MVSKIKKFIFYKTRTKKETYIFVFILVVLFFVSSTVMAVYLLPKDDRTNFLLGTGGVTMTGANPCYIGNPTPTLYWYYEKGFVPVTIPRLPHPAFPPGEDQKSFRIQIHDNITFTSLVYDSNWAVEPDISTSFFVPVSANLSTNITYYWQIDVRDVVNSETGWIDGGSFVTPPSCTPTNLTQTPFGTTCGQPSFTWGTSLTWTGYGDHNYYNVEHSVDGNPPWTRIGVAPFPSSENQAIQLVPGATRFYHVSAEYNSSGAESNFSSSIQVTAPSACNPYIDPNPSFNCDSVTINWTATGTVTSYDIFRTTTNHPYGLNENKVFKGNTTNSYFQDNDIVSGSVLYEYFVEANAASGETLEAYSTITVDSPCQNLPIWVEGG